MRWLCAQAGTEKYAQKCNVERDTMRIHSNCIPESHEYINKVPAPLSLSSPTSLQPTQLSKASPVFTTPNIQNERPRMQLRHLLPVPCRLLQLPCM
ncbi:uncharacterized protein N7487_005934 [Penicillium crustosum]|uniref:uncharacterized protein n=1 Tax=Penicillium crustosum TaxID=36656 RepID=UPI002383F6A7|nr:uncharacterized protein N7487_005934 [Penicillium crustosum]KAJ5411575.1 hypothetical protein N7487_005934 [Penicillium crustosum]